MDDGLYHGGRWGQVNNLNRVWQSALTAAQFRVASYLVGEAKPDGYCTVSVAEIRKATGLATKTIRNAITKLRRLGLITGKPGIGGRGCEKVTRRILIPPTIPPKLKSDGAAGNCPCSGDSYGEENCPCGGSKLSLGRAQTVPAAGRPYKEQNYRPTDPPNPRGGSEGAEGEEPETEGAVPPGFAQFWTLWPDLPDRKVGRQKCLRHWNHRQLERISDKVIDCLRRFKASSQWAREGSRYVPKPIRWLNDTPWETEPAGRRDNGQHVRGRLQIVRT